MYALGYGSTVMYYTVLSNLIVIGWNKYTLELMQMTIISLVFEFGLKGVHQWRSSVDYILEKGKGPVLGKLRTIKLLECDLNFGLK